MQTNDYHLKWLSVTWNHKIVYKLLVFNKNTWNHVTMGKLFALDGLFISYNSLQTNDYCWQIKKGG